MGVVAGGRLKVEVPRPRFFCETWGQSLYCIRQSERNMVSEEEEIYQDHILDHYEDPYHRGHCQRCTHAHQDDNPLCGDVIRMELQIDEEGTLREVFFAGDGCCISQASASMLVEQFDGGHVDDVKRFTAEEMLDLFSVRLTPNRQKCCLLPWQVLQSAIYSPVDGQAVPVGGSRPAGGST